MINLPLRRIQTLIFLAETGSFRGAAARLGISQPAVSAHVRALEEQYGVPLVHRTTRQVALTPEGKAFAARALRAFEDLELATRDLHDVSAAQHGQVTVACIPPLMSLLMPRVVEALAAERPSIEVRLRDATSSALHGLVAGGEAELGIGPPATGSRLKFRRLRRDEFVAVVPRQHALAGRLEVTLAEVIQYPIIANSRPTSARHILDDALQRLHSAVTPRFELTHYDAIGRFVEAGLGVAVLPRTAFDNLATRHLVAIGLRSPRLWRDIGLMWRREYRPSPAATAFISVLQAAIAASRRN
jgi:LysR family carnitine catabolism transcriptional activator